MIIVAVGVSLVGRTGKDGLVHGGVGVVGVIQPNAVADLVGRCGPDVHLTFIWAG